MAIVVRTAGHHLVDVFQRGGFDVDDYFALTRFWIREFLEARRFSKRTQYGSFHGHLIFFFALIAIKTRAARWQRPNEIWMEFFRNVLRNYSV
jgi:hypothetical protein